MRDPLHVLWCYCARPVPECAAAFEGHLKVEAFAPSPCRKYFSVLRRVTPHSQRREPVTRLFGLIFSLAIIVAALIGCQKTDTAVEKAATDVKDKVVADAKGAEAMVKEKEAQDTGIEAYTYAYPLVTMELTRRVSTNVAAPLGSKAPMGQFAKLRGY